jgi:hypothetical protein
MSYEPRSGGRIFRRSGAHPIPNLFTTAFSRGYTLPPLRGYLSQVCYYPFQGGEAGRSADGGCSQRMSKNAF